MAIPVIFDTDIGTDVDDILALGVILGSPELDLIGVTCVHADVAVRSRMIRKVLGLRGRTDIPVHEGISESLMRFARPYWAGWEGAGLLEPGEELAPGSPEHAVDYLVRVINERPGEIHLIAVGPLTNVAVALLRDPSIAGKLRHLTIMGGQIRHRAGSSTEMVEHNIKLDPDAAHIVAVSGAPQTWIPLDVTTQVPVRQDGVDRILAGGTPYHAAIAGQISAYPTFARTGSTWMHDPLAVAAVIRPDLVGLTPFRLDIEFDGRFTRGVTRFRHPEEGTLATVQAAETVESDAAARFICDRIGS